MAIDKELQDYYEARMEMFASKGWRDMVEDVEKMMLALDNISAVKDGDDLHFKKGEMSIIKWILNIEDMSRKAFEELKNEAN